MSTMHDADRRAGVERPSTPAQAFAAASGTFLVALGVLVLVFSDVSFGTVDSLAGQPEFLVWTANGWTAVFWIAMGAVGLLSTVRLDAARAYALLAGVVFAVVAVWGFIDGSDVASVLVADTANNVMHAVLAVIALVTGMPPRSAQKPHEPAPRTSRSRGESRFESGDRIHPLDRGTAGRR